MCVLKTIYLPVCENAQLNKCISMLLTNICMFQIGSLLSPMLRLNCRPSFSVTMDFVSSRATQERKSCRNHVSVTLCMGHLRALTQYLELKMLFRDRKRNRWKYYITKKMVCFFFHFLSIILLYVIEVGFIQRFFFSVFRPSFSQSAVRKRQPVFICLYMLQFVCHER